jgi:hypothetical protein
MPWMVHDAKFQANHRGNAAPGPEFSPKAVSDWPPPQEVGQAGEWRGGQPMRGAEWGAMPQYVGAGCAGTRPPWADGAFADAERLGHLALGPALLLEAPGLQPSSFFPVGRYPVHTWKSITKSSRT